MSGSACTTEQMMEYLIDRCAHAGGPDGVAEILGRLVWRSDDNGAEICQVRDRWLRGDDRFRAEVALVMTELFPAKSRQEMVELFVGIIAQWPDLREKCDSWLRDWDAQRREA